MRIAGVLCAALLLVACAASGCSDNQAPTTPTSTSTSIPPSIPTGLSGPLTQMLNGLNGYITSVKAENQALLPINQQYRAQIESKIASLTSPSLFADIINGRRWVEGVAPSTVGPAVPIALVFMLEPMRGESDDTVRVIETGLPVLERIFNTRFPGGTVRVWYGFRIGSLGGGGQIYVEDRTTFTGRAPSLPYDPTLMHELSHSYVSNEILNQFLELYVYNVSRTGQVDPATWTFTRNWTPGLTSNTGSAAVMDVYQLIGHDAMLNAYRAVYPLRPPYGSPLSSAVIDAFLSAVPAEHHAAVSAKLATFTF